VVNVRLRTIHPSEPETETDVENIVHLLQSVSQTLRELYRRDESLATHYPHLPILREIAGQPGITVNKLARALNTTKSHISVSVARLVDQGLVTRAPDPRDKRLGHLHITPAGRRRAASWGKANHRVLAGALDRLTADDLSVVVDGLERFHSALQVPAITSTVPRGRNR